MVKVSFAPRRPTCELAGAYEWRAVNPPDWAVIGWGVVGVLWGALLVLVAMGV